MRAFLFPGQGSQQVGMGRSLCEGSATAASLFEAAEDVLGLPLRRLCFSGPESELRLTANTQPALLTTSMAALTVLGERTDLKPDWMAGHSLGEIAALVAAGSLRFVDGLRLVRLRGQAMQDAVPAGAGAMAAIVGLNASQVDEICAATASALGQVVTVANINGPGQIVVSGHAEAVGRVREQAGGRGARATMALAVSAPFHCPLMAPAAERLAEMLGTIELLAPSVPLVTNVDAQPCRDAAQLRRSLVRQVTSPVQWEASMQALAAAGVTEAFELGPGAVLAGLMRRCAPRVQVFAAGEWAAIEAIGALETTRRAKCP
jgi:[acyl-carrier-protein] S-malonyltransferase